MLPNDEPSTKSSPETKGDNHRDEEGPGPRLNRNPMTMLRLSSVHAAV